jgi:hypothetical protein
MSVIDLKQRYQITKLALVTNKDVQFLGNDGSGIGPNDVGQAGWKIVSTFIAPGETQHGVAQFVYGLWQQTYD